MTGGVNMENQKTEWKRQWRDALGILPSIELRGENDKQYVAVTVDASGTPVSFRGRHYIRSGSTTQELNGHELDNFILRRLKDTVKDTVKDTHSDTLNDTQNQILDLLMSNQRMTVKAISTELEINERNVKKNIKVLKDAGYIERAGSDRSGHWIMKMPKIEG
jgi:ATP-dependent DNA helicase RecG